MLKTWGPVSPPPFFWKFGGRFNSPPSPPPPCTRWSGSALSGERTVSYHSSIQELLIINTLYLQAFLNYRYIALGTLSQLQIRPLKSAGPINTILIPDLLHSYAFHAISSFPKLRFTQWNSTLQKYLFDWKLNAPPPKMTLSPTQWPNTKKKVLIDMPTPWLIFACMRWNVMLYRCAILMLRRAEQLSISK